MVAGVIVALVSVVALPFVVRLGQGHRARRRARHFVLRSAWGPGAHGAVGHDPSDAAMRAALSSFGWRVLVPPLVVVHRYRRHGQDRAALTVVAHHPDRVAELIARAAGARCEPVDALDLPAAPVLRHGRQTVAVAPSAAVSISSAHEGHFASWVASVLAGAGEDCLVSVGVTPAARRGRDGLLRARILACAGDPVTADTLAAGSATQLPGDAPAMVSRRPGDGPILIAGTGLALAAGLVAAVGATVHGQFSTAVGGLRAGVLSAGAVAGVAATRLVRVTESCWRGWLSDGIVLPAGPWRPGADRAAGRGNPVMLTPAQWAALCAPPTPEPAAPVDREREGDAPGTKPTPPGRARAWVVDLDGVAPYA